MAKVVDPGDDSMEVFDELPPEVRQILRDLNHSWDPHDAHRLVRMFRGFPPSDRVRYIREHYQQAEEKEKQVLYSSYQKGEPI